MYADLEMKAKAPLPGPGGREGEVTIDGNDVAFGFGLGALFEVNERTRFGLVYQSEIEPEFDGDVDLSPLGLTAATDTKSHWHALSSFPGTTNSTTSGRCLEPLAGKTGARLRMSTSPPIRGSQDPTRLARYLEICGRRALPSG